MYFVKQIYKNLVPDSLRRRVRIFRDRNTELGILRTNFIDYYTSLPSRMQNGEFDEIVSYVKEYGVATFPYKFTHKYDPAKIEVHKDTESGLLYVLQEGKRLYFKRSWDEQTVRESYNFLLIEQDKKSPHRYLTDNFTVNHGDVVMDIGTAEGNFALSIVDKAGSLFIFEADPEWIEALTATFAPWNNKVHIINKYVSDIVDNENITVDEILKEKTKVNFIKIDAEGAEKKILTGAQTTLELNPDLRIAICTYHKQQDENELAQLLKCYQFQTPLSDGYMFFLEEKLSPPFLRKVLIRAYK